MRPLNVHVYIMVHSDLMVSKCIGNSVGTTKVKINLTLD